MSDLIHHIIEKDNCKICSHEDWHDDKWDVFEDSHHGAFETKETTKLDRINLP